MSSSTFNRRIASHYLLYRGGLLRNGIVELDKAGLITLVWSAERIDSLHSTEFFGGVLMPEVVNAFGAAPQGQILVELNRSFENGEIEQLIEHHGSALHWVVSEQSADYLEELDTVRRLRGNICIGTPNSIVEVLRRLNHIPLNERLDWATRGGAAALGTENAGVVEVGEQVKFATLSGIDFDDFSVGERSRINRIR